MGATEVARSLAVVLQEQPTDLGLTARQIVALGRLPHRRGWGAGLAHDADTAIVEASLMRMDLGALADRSLDTLSGGSVSG